jgi:hypothetical protein
VSVRNPEGGDYDKIGPSLSKPTWGYTAKWADMVLYGALDLQVAKDDPKSKIAKNKAKGGRVRLLHCQPTGAYEAKNVHRLPPTLRLGDDAQRAYDAFRAAFPRKETVAPSPAPPGQPPTSAGNADVPRAAASGTPAADGSAGQVVLEELASWIRKLQFTEADIEELCVEHHLSALKDATEAQARKMIAELSEMFARWQQEQSPAREPGEDEPDES